MDGRGFNDEVTSPLSLSQLHISSTSLNLPTIEKKALDAARNAKPRVRVLRRRDNKPAKVLISGCQGSGKTPQERAAALFEQVVKESVDGPPDCIIFLGDNLYNNGAESPNDKAFIDCFYEMYGKKFPHLAPIPCFLIIGNHDGNYHWKSYYNPNAKWGKEVELKEVAHFYMPDERYTSVEAKIEFANRTDVYFDELPKYNMQHLFDSIIIDGTQHFFLNSNSYPQDYFEYKTQVFSTEINQAQWLEEEYKKARNCDFLYLDTPPENGKIRQLPLLNNAAYVRTGNELYYVDKYANTATKILCSLDELDSILLTENLKNFPNYQRELNVEEINFLEAMTGHHHGRKIIFDQHHPLYTSGKRAFYEDFDTALYPINNNLEALQKLLNKMTVSYNDLFIDLYKEQNMYPDLFNVAHDHFVSIFNNKEDDTALYKFAQLTLGAGGQDLQSRVSFTGHPFVAQHMKSSGCCMLREDPKDANNLLLEITAASNYPNIKPYTLLYSLKNHKAIREPISDPKIYDLRARALTICAEYLMSLSKNEPKPDANTPNIAPSRPPKDKAQPGFLGVFSTFGSKVSNLYTKTYKSLFHDPIKAKEVITVHNLMAFFNQHRLPSLSECLLFLNTVIEALPNKDNEKDTTHLLYKTLTTELYNPELIKKRYEMDLDSVMNRGYIFNSI